MLAGWSSVEEYYNNSSSADSVPVVGIPLLCIQVELSFLCWMYFKDTAHSPRLENLNCWSYLTLRL